MTVSPSSAEPAFSDYKITWDDSGAKPPVSDSWRRALGFYCPGTGTAGATRALDLHTLVLLHTAAGTAINCIPASTERKAWGINYSLFRDESPEPSDGSHENQRSADLVVELHAESGLTWQQIAKLFNVSRRAVHGWASGGRMNAPNLERLGVILRAVRAVAAADSEDRRQKLLTPGADSISIYDRLKQSDPKKIAVEDTVGVRERIGERRVDKA